MQSTQQVVAFPVSDWSLRRELVLALRWALGLLAGHLLWLAYACGKGRPQPWLQHGADVAATLLVVEVMGLPFTLIAGCAWVCRAVSRARDGRAWPWDVRLLVVANVSLPLAYAALHWLGPPLERAAVARVVTRGEPLVAAIKRYESEHGEPPFCLAELVPRYLESLPSTGLRGGPEFAYARYEARPDSRVAADRRTTWRLAVHLPSGPVFHDALQTGPGTRSMPGAGCLAAAQPGGEWRLYHLWIQWDRGNP